MNEIRDIQTQLDQLVEDRCKHEWREAKHKIAVILRPFYAELASTAYEAEQHITEFRQNLRLDSYNSIILPQTMSPPAAYIKQQKENEARLFIEKVKRMPEISQEEDELKLWEDEDEDVFE